MLSSDPSSPIAKRSFNKDLLHAFQSRDILADERILLGKLEDYSSNDFSVEVDLKAKVFIHFGLIYVTFATSMVHEKMTAAIAEAVSLALKKYGVVLSFAPTIDCINFLGCKSRFGKIPDACFMIRDKFKGLRKDPCIVVESVYTNETYEMGLYEAAAWLSSTSQVEFCFLSFINPSADRFAVELFVCKRATEQQFFSSPEEREAAKVEAIKKSKNRKSQKRFCIPIDIRKLSLQEIEESFGIKIIGHQIINDENCKDGINIKLPTAGLVSGSNAVIDVPEVDLNISGEDLEEVSNAFYENQDERAKRKKR